MTWVQCARGFESVPLFFFFFERMSSCPARFYPAEKTPHLRVGDYCFTFYSAQVIDMEPKGATLLYPGCAYGTDHRRYDEFLVLVYGCV